jgi:hypothetical protein
MTHSNHDAEYLLYCRELVAKKLNWRPAEEWRNYEFTELSEKILDATGVNLSSTTLKRVFGKVKYESLPSTATLNALAAYLGYASWMELKSKLHLKKDTVEKTLPVQKRRVFPHRKAWLAGAAIISICLILAFTFLPKKSIPVIENTEAIVFKSKPLAEGLPNSVVFAVDLKGNKPHQTIIQQSWDSTRTVALQPGQTEATGIYYVPGYFRAKLILDGKIVKEHDLFIKSEQWMGTIEQQSVVTYVKKDELVLNKGMNVRKPVLSAIEKLTTPAYLTYHFVKDFGGLQSDNFSLETAIQNTYAEGPAVCKTAKIFILCKERAFIIPFTIPGCISDINLKASDLYLNGKSNDLSSFSADLSNWSPVKVEVQNRKLKIWLNGKLIREEVYKQDAGEIVGLRFSFLGAGAVQYVRLLDRENKVVYEK